MTNRVAQQCEDSWRLSVHKDSSDAIMKRNGLGFFELILVQSGRLIEVDSTASPITTGLTAALSHRRLISEEVHANIRRNGNPILKTWESTGVTQGRAKIQRVHFKIPQFGHIALKQTHESGS